jgi:hypothetical protein
MPARSDVRLCIKTATELKGLLWVSFLPEECISVGFSDKTFVVPMLISRSDRVAAAQSEVLDLAGIHGKESVKNPHFTLHPPGHFHLKSENGTVLCEALVWTEPEPGHEVSPWVEVYFQPYRDTSLVSAAGPWSKSTDLYTSPFKVTNAL